MNQIHFLRFSACDNPMQLNKIGNWVITFRDITECMPIQLAITHVIPPQISDHLQLRSLYLQQMQNSLDWQMIQLEYTENTQAKIISSDFNSSLTLNFIKQLIHEFKRYDVELSYFSE